jgi:tripartite-type tricarboxylate transporter receptor subunit TctC
MRILQLLLPALAGASANAAYPDRPIRLIAPFAPGGNIDITARTVAPGLTEHLGQQVIVENRGGAGGRIGTELVAKAPADGYTMLLASSGMLTINAAFSTKPAYDPLRDFAGVSTVALAPIVLTVHPSLPAKTLTEFLALARARPGAILMASAGTGSNTHLTGELFQAITGVKLTHVPYKGTSPALIDLVGGQTQCIFDQVSTSSPMVASGKLRAIALAAAKRSAVLPNVPTMAEAGVKEFEAATYTGVFLPAATPRDVQNRVYAALTRTLDMSATRDAFARVGAEVAKSTPEELSKRLVNDLARWRKVQQMTGLKLD